jgi:hypothetical protein
MTRVTSQGYKTKKEYDERYKKYGFESVELMKVFQSNGYETMLDYEMVKGRTPEWFINNCKNSSHYMNDCFGKKIIWYGIVNSVGPSAVSISVRGDKGDKLKTSDPFSLRIDSKSLKHHGVKKGQLIEFHGRIDQENFVIPDIENISLVRFEPDEAQKLREKRRVNQIVKEKRKKKRFNKKIDYNLKNLSEGRQKEMLTELLYKSGKDCGKATKVFLQGYDKDGATYWNVACSNGESYGVQIPFNPVKNTRILECSVMRALDIDCFEKLN